MVEKKRRRRRSAASGSEAQNVSFRTLSAGRQQRADISRQTELNDPLVGVKHVLNPPFRLKFLDHAKDVSNVLSQCIDAYVVNVASYGYEIVPRYEGVEVDPEERDFLSSFIEYPNVDESLVDIHKKKVEDYETYGFSFMEVVRDLQKRVSVVRHASSYYVRVLSKDETPVPVEHEIVRGNYTSKIKEYRRFRRYVMEKGGKRVYFKEFGDPREMDFETGEYASEKRSRGRGKRRIPRERQATELLHHRQYSQDSYGLPRWISHIPSILGSREVEEVNLRYFEDNTVPPMLLSVAGGRLTRQSFQELKTLLQEEGVGKDRQNKILLIEAVPESTGIEDKGSAKIQIDKLSDARQSDALFGKYDEANQHKVRSAFRLPPVLIGLSQDVTFATAQVSSFIAETQVFAPERSTHDDFLNKKLINHPMGFNLQTVRLKSRGPSITNPDQIVKTLTAMNVMGAVTPRSAIEMANNSLQFNLPQYPEPDEEGYEEWMDRPIQFALRGRDPNEEDSPENTHLEQSVKNEEAKETEESGDINPRQPEHGNE